MRTAKTARNIETELALALDSGEWGAGERLPEARLAKRFQVSRPPPVREVVRRLTAAGVLEQVPNQAPRVRVSSEDELKNLYDLRIELEGYALERAAMNVTDAKNRNFEMRRRGARSWRTSCRRTLHSMRRFFAGWFASSSVSIAP